METVTDGHRNGNFDGNITTNDLIINIKCFTPSFGVIGISFKKDLESQKQSALRISLACVMNKSVWVLVIIKTNSC